MFSNLRTLLFNDYWCVPYDFHALTCILEHSPGPKHNIEMKGGYCLMGPPASISEHLEIVEVKCEAVDERVLKVLDFLYKKIRVSKQPHVAKKYKAKVLCDKVVILSLWALHVKLAAEHHSMAAVRGANPMALCSQHHPSPAGCGVGCANSGDLVVATSCGRASYKDVVLRALQEEPGWQVVCKRRARRTSGVRHGVPQSQTSIKEDFSLRRRAYLQKMKGKCFNCLAHGHFVAQCRNSTRCWFCQCLGHISTWCPNRKREKHCSSDSATTNSFSAAQEKQKHQKGHSSGEAPTPTHKTGGVVVIVDDSLLHLEHYSPPATRGKLLDPMVLEALIMSEMHNTGSGATSPSPSAFLSHIVNDLPISEGMTQNQPGECCKSLPLALPIPMSVLPISQSLDDTQSPLITRNEAEQLTGYELIKALSSLKHGEMVHVPPSTMENKSSFKEATVVTPEDNQHCNQKLKFKIESQKPSFRMVRDMLTKKWIFVKEVQQLGDWTLQRFLRACKKPTRASRFETIRNRVKRAMLMKAIKKLTQESQKMKKKKKIS
ncbi:hypothetical protein EJB05_28653, partial [Eragrostis curvula]